MTPYVDGELGAEDETAVDQHLRLCTPCRSRIDAERSVCTLFRERKAELKAEQAPAALRARCRQTRPTTCSRSRRPRDRGPGAAAGPLAMAATFVLLVGSAVFYRATVGSTQVIAAELTADHVKCFMLNSVLGRTRASRKCEADMQSGFDWAAQLPEHPEAANLELVGSRPCLYERGKIAHLMYRHHGVPVSIFMLPGHNHSSEFLQALGHDAVIWSDDRRTFVLIAKAPRPEVERVATFVQASLR